jgi:hypothetical protein
MRAGKHERHECGTTLVAQRQKNGTTTKVQDNRASANFRSRSNAGHQTCLWKRRPAPRRALGRYFGLFIDYIMDGINEYRIVRRLHESVTTHKHRS